MSSEQQEWKITVNSPWFEYAKNGTKIYEGRCFWNNTVKYKVGDILNIHHHTDETCQPFSAVVEEILKFPTFEHALKSLSLDVVLPGVKSVEEGVKIYLQYYSLESQIQHGVCMIKIGIY
jgi:ASC-1-like (ASCH) protein